MNGLKVLRRGDAIWLGSFHDHLLTRKIWNNVNMNFSIIFPKDKETEY